MTLFERAIDAIPHEDGWWHDDNRQTFQALGAQLLAKGLTTEDALDVLTTAFHAVADEFGA